MNDQPPGRIVRVNRVLTEAEAERIRQRLRRALASGQPPQILGLPRRVRARLWLIHHIDHAAIWLTDHGHHRAAIALWRVFRLW
jgi:hypothetical protein